MKKYIFIITSFLFTITLPVVGQDLAQNIELNAQEKTLEEILQHIQAEYEVTFSYLNNDLPTTRRSVQLAGKSLDDVLDILLRGTELDYLVVGDRIIIKRKKQQPIPIPAPPTADQPQDKDIAISNDEVVDPTDSVIATTTPETSASPYTPDGDSIVTVTAAVTDTQVKQVKDTLSHQASEILLSPDTAVKKKHRIFHGGLFYPLSTNGSEATHYINNISLNLFSGLSGGTNGMDISTIANVIKGGNLVGLQVSGFTNVVKGNASGLQVAGAFNLVTEKMAGAQLSLASNVVGGKHLGVQITGAVNVVKGDVGGFQGSMGVNYAKGIMQFGQVSTLNFAQSVQGPQLAVFMNMQKAGGKGLQAAGFMNRTGALHGLQVAGFLNKADTVKGAQVAGFLNIARKVEGAQIGFINIADSLTGVPIGFFSIAKENGYFDLELFYADDFQANAIIKVGASAFHNLFGLSYETNYKNRWAYGYGFGSQIGKKNFRINLDAMAYYVVEQKFPNGAFKDYELNLLSKFRMLGSLHYNNFGLFAGPVFNVMVSQVVDEDTASVGSDIVSKTLFDNTDRYGNNVKIWLGYNVGIRF